MNKNNSFNINLDFLSIYKFGIHKVVSFDGYSGVLQGNNKCYIVTLPCNIFIAALLWQQ